MQIFLCQAVYFAEIGKYTYSMQLLDVYNAAWPLNVQYGFREKTKPNLNFFRVLYMYLFLSPNIHLEILA